MMGYGTKVKIGKGALNVYSEGQGEYTIVIMSGSGVCAPALEYRPLYRKLSDKYRIAVIEKPGYGLSESTGTERTVQNLVSEDRQALLGAGIKPPYILMPHSYSGCEALYWANTYTDEVKAVLSIDMGLPSNAEEYGKVMTPQKLDTFIEKNKKLYAFIKKRGFLTKIFKNSLENTTGMMTSDCLTADEKALYEHLFYKNLGNEDIFSETRLLVSNHLTAGQTGSLKIPAFFYISDMKFPAKQGTWRERSVAYAKSINAPYKLTDKGHLMYSKIPDEMASEFKAFLQKNDL